MFRTTVVLTVSLAFLYAVGCHRLRVFVSGDTEESIVASDFSDVPQVCRLAMAIDRGDRQEIAEAVAAGADVNAYSRNGFRLLDWAFVRSRLVGFEALLELGADVMAEYREPAMIPDASFNSSILQRILEADHAECLAIVLRKGMHPDHIPFAQDGRPLLSYGVKSRGSRVLKALLDAGARVDQGDRWGATALHDAGRVRNYQAAWLLMQRNADPLIKDSWGKDFVAGLKEYGSRGVRPEQREYFEKVVDELVRRGLLTRQDIVEADKPKKTAVPGVEAGGTVIEHSPLSEAGRAIWQLDTSEREAAARGK